MLTAILDAGSNTVHLKLAASAAGEPPRTVAEAKFRTRLAESITGDGRIPDAAINRLAGAVDTAVRAASSFAAGPERPTELIAFTTSAVREAPNRDAVVDRVAAETGVRLGLLSGEDEARLTFLAARAWYGYSPGALLLADIGGGSVELAAGDGSEPAVLLSAPLGAGRLTRDHLPGDPPRRKDVKNLRRYIAAELTACLGSDDGPAAGHLGSVRAVATSKTFAQLAKVTGGKGQNGQRVLRVKPLRKQARRLARLTAAQRAKVKGVSASRAGQVVAGAMVAEQLMDALGADCIDICPWALREGVALWRLHQVGATAAARDGMDHLVQPLPQAPPQTDLHDGGGNGGDVAILHPASRQDRDARAPARRGYAS